MSTSFDDLRSILQQARVALPSTTTPAASASSSSVVTAASPQLGQLRSGVAASSGRSEVCPPPVLERDSFARRAPPAVTPGPLPPRGNGAHVASQPRDPATEPPVRPPGAPAWLRIGGRGARERYARGDGVCLWVGQAKHHRMGGVEASPIDVRRVRSALKGGADRRSKLDVARGAARVACSLMAAGISPRVFVPTMQARAAMMRWSGAHGKRAAWRWLRRVCGRPIGLRALVAAWRKAHPEHWASTRVAC